jgi:hypothetical protein
MCRVSIELCDLCGSARSASVAVHIGLWRVSLELRAPAVSVVIGGHLARARWVDTSTVRKSTVLARHGTKTIVPVPGTTRCSASAAANCWPVSSPYNFILPQTLGIYYPILSFFSLPPTPSSPAAAPCACAAPQPLLACVVPHPPACSADAVPPPPTAAPPLPPLRPRAASPPLFPLCPRAVPPPSFHLCPPPLDCAAASTGRSPRPRCCVGALDAFTASSSTPGRLPLPRLPLVTFFAVVPRRALQCCRARWHDTARSEPFRVVPVSAIQHGGTRQHDTMGRRAT